MHRGRALVGFILGALLPLGCESAPKAPPAPPPPPGQVNAEGFSLVVVTDISRSMDQNDPQGFNREGAKLAVALANVSDNLALVPFSNEVGRVQPLTEMRDESSRRSLVGAIDQLRNNGRTDYVKALETTRVQLDATGGQTAVIFLSDGDHNPDTAFFSDKTEEQQIAVGERRILELADGFGADDHRVYAIALGRDITSTTLEDMASRSGGAAYRVGNDASRVLDAYLEILGDVYGLFQYERDPRDLNLGRTARRLLYVHIKNGGQSGGQLATSISHDGAAATPIYRQEGSAFDVVQFGGELPGRWQCGLTGGGVVALTKLPMTFSLVAGAPGGDYAPGDRVPLRLQALCDDAEAATAAFESVTVTVVTEAGALTGESVVLRAERQGLKVVWSGSTTARRLSPDDGQPEPQNVAFEIRDGDWTHTKKTSLRVLPGPPPPPPTNTPADAIRPEPTSLSLGDHWAGEVRFAAPLTIANVSEATIDLTFAAKGAPWLAAPAAVPGIGPSMQVAVSVRPAGQGPGAGRQSGQLVVSGRYVEAEHADKPLDDQPVDVDLTVHQLGVAELAGPTLTPKAKAQLTAPVQAVPADTRYDVVQTSASANPAGAQVTWPKSFDAKGFTLGVSVPEHTPGGTWKGRFTARPAGTSLTPRPYELSFTVEGSRPVLTVEGAPTLVYELKNRPGEGQDLWVPFPDGVSLGLAHHSAVKPSIQRAELIGDNGETIPEFDIQVKRSDPGDLAPGGSLTLSLAFKMHDLLKAGRYTGKLTVSVPAADGQPVSVEVPVVVELK